ncbi:MAG: 3-oxoacyl-ACP reductase FabG [Planctomycetes bacterium]|nr:3-oxoacyl-ACP reductase FabG [Planctomycetota bacterium]
MYDFTEQTVIVTGGTRGIGRAVSESFLKAGAKVVATYGGNTEAAEKFVAEQGEAKDRSFIEKFDVADYGSVETFFKTFGEKYGTLQILVNNAGIRRDSVLAMMKQEDWQRVIDTNLGGVFNMCKFGVQEMMTERYGRIINITSPSGKFGFEGQCNYASSKAGMVALTKSLSKEVAKRKITVNCVSPGYIDTELLSDLPEDLVKEYKKSVPVKRFGTPEEVAHAILFLAAKESAYITGATIEVTGGL